MSSIQVLPLPPAALLDAYRRSGAYTDCFATEVPPAITLAQYIAAFYTTSVFKAERLILKYAIGRPSTDDQARQLAAGALDRFAAWDVEQRAPDQILLRAGRTRSWLMVEALPGGGTRLYFGSAVVPRTGKAGLGFPFGAMLGLHRLYSRVLLRVARRRLLAV